MRYVVAVIGALFIFGVTFFLALLFIGFLASIFPPIVMLENTNGLIAALLAALASTSSFKATLKHYNQKQKRMQETRESAASEHK